MALSRNIRRWEVGLQANCCAIFCWNGTETNRIGMEEEKEERKTETKQNKQEHETPPNEIASSSPSPSTAGTCKQQAATLSILQYILTTMHIKQITISNFRSFRQQPEIHPFAATTNCVLGRNGSGKSNLFDAVQFVLLSPRFATLRSVRYIITRLHVTVSIV